MAISGIFSVLWTFLSSICYLLLTRRLLTALRLSLSMTPGPCGDCTSPSSNNSVLPGFSLFMYESDSEQWPGTCGNPHISFLVFGRAFMNNSPGHIVLVVMLQQVQNKWSTVGNFQQCVFALTYFSLFYVYSEIR